MPKSFNRYEYGTSPRKIEPEYTTNKKKKVINSNKKLKTTTQKHIKIKKIKIKNQKLKTIIYILSLFSVLFAIAFRNASIDQNFKKVEQLKQELSTIKKQNDQLQISIENSLNLSNLEKQAKELLGMQKLTNKQTVYINLPKTDYIETPSEQVKIDENNSIFEKIANIFKK